MQIKNIIPKCYIHNASYSYLSNYFYGNDNLTKNLDSANHTHTSTLRFEAILHVKFQLTQISINLCIYIREQSLISYKSKHARSSWKLHRVGKQHQTIWRNRKISCQLNNTRPQDNYFRIICLHQLRFKK